MPDALEMLGDDVKVGLGRSWWMSATRPAAEFSIGIIASPARPSATAAKVSPKVLQGRVVIAG